MMGWWGRGGGLRPAGACCTKLGRMTYVLSAVAWPYANGPRHIGHIAGFGVPSDVYSRYMRLRGHDVLMVSGTDEHGTPILVQADKEGAAPQDLADRYNRMIVDEFVALGLSYDMFTRTTTTRHHKVVQDLFTVLHRNGYMVAQTTHGAISPSTGRTLPDRYIEGTCPKCGAGGARGDQCDTCGNQLEADELINPVSKLNGETPKFVETEHFFLDLPALADALREWLVGREASGTWRPNVIKFSMNLVDDMRPRAMTRDIDWGIRVPLEGWQDNPLKRFYVWFDAVIGYLSASIEWAERRGTPDAWRKWWNNPDAVSCYYMGKDNITFHSQIWPAEILAYNGAGARGGEPGEYGELMLPTNVVSSEFLTMEGAKFSSSKGVVLYVRDVLERYQPDALRYFIAAAGPETQDSDFTWAEFVRRTNDELVAGWGNLVNRTLSLLHKNVGELPEPGEYQPEDTVLLAAVEAGFDEVGGLIEEHRYKQAIGAAMRLVGEANKYLADTAPWQLKKTDPERMKTVLFVAAQAICDCNTMLSVFMPHSANVIYAAFGGVGELAPMPRVEEVTDAGSGATYPIITGDYTSAVTWGRTPVQPGAVIEKPTPVFTKLDPEVVDIELARMSGETAPEAADV